MASKKLVPRRHGRLRVTSTDRPGWEDGDGSIPFVGERVFCLEGHAEVVRVLGRTSDGSRLLELHLIDGPKTPYFAAASNVLRRAEGDGDEAPADGTPLDPHDFIPAGPPSDLIGEPDR